MNQPIKQAFIEKISQKRASQQGHNIDYQKLKSKTFPNLDSQTLNYINQIEPSNYRSINSGFADNVRMQQENIQGHSFVQ